MAHVLQRIALYAVFVNRKVLGSKFSIVSWFYGGCNTAGGFVLTRFVRCSSYNSNCLRGYASEINDLKCFKPLADRYTSVIWSRARGYLSRHLCGIYHNLSETNKVGFFPCERWNLFATANFTIRLEAECAVYIYPEYLSTKEISVEKQGEHRGHICQH